MSIIISLLASVLLIAPIKAADTVKLDNRTYTGEEFSKELVRVPGAKVFLSLRLPGFRRASPSDIPPRLWWGF